MKIGIHKYRIVYKEMDDCGRTSRRENIIYIRKDLSDSEKLVTLWHEILHVINGELNEVLVDSLAQQITGVLKDNRLCYDEKHISNSINKMPKHVKKLVSSHNKKKKRVK